MFYEQDIITKVVEKGTSDHGNSDHGGAFFQIITN